MRIKWIYLLIIIIKVLGQNDEYCELQNKDNSLITIATGENYDFHLLDYVIADDLVYQIKTDSATLINPPFTFMIQKYKHGIFNDQVIDIISIYDEIFTSSYYCFQRYTQDDNISYKLVRCQFIINKEMKFQEIEFFIKRDYCYQLNYSYGSYYITCQDNLTNQLELIIFNPITKRYQSILIDDIIIPPESIVKTKVKLYYFGVLINKGRIENDKYISEYSQLYFFFINFTTSTKNENDQKITLYKQYEVLNQPDDYVTDFDIYYEIAFITRFNGGLTFRNLKIAWSNEIKVLNNNKKVFGVHIPKNLFEASTSDYYILLMIWGESQLLFVSIQIDKTYQVQQQEGFLRSTLLKGYSLNSEKVFSRKVTSSNQYVIFSNDEEFSIFSIDFTQYKGVLLIYSGYVNSRFYFLNLCQVTLFFEEQNIVYGLDLELPKIVIVNINEIKSPQLLQIKASTFDKQFAPILCPDIKIYYQVQALNANAIWPLFYKETEQNVVIIKYTKKELTYSKYEFNKEIDLSKILLGQALNIEQIILNKKSKFQANFQNIVQEFKYLNINNEELESVEYATNCKFTYPGTNHKIYLFIKMQKYLHVMDCSYIANQQCFYSDTLVIQDDDIQDLYCKTQGQLLQVVIVQKIKHGFVGDQISSYYLFFGQFGDLNSFLQNKFQESKGDILSLALYPNILIYTSQVNNIYTLNLRELEKEINQVNSIELNCFKAFELVCDITNYSNIIFVPMIQNNNFIHYVVIEIYIIQHNSKLEYSGTINLGQTKKPTKEKLQIELTQEGIIILQLTDISQDKQNKQLYFIHQLIFSRNFLNKKIKGEISIHKFRSKIIPTFQLKTIYKIKTSERFLYVYGSEIDVPACIYIYRLYSNQMDSLYHIIRTDLQSFQVYNVISMKQMDLILISFNQFKRILLNPNKIITLRKQTYLEQYQDELFELKIKPLATKDNDNIQDFYIKLTCSDCERINDSS